MKASTKFNLVIIFVITLLAVNVYQFIYSKRLSSDLESAESDIYDLERKLKSLDSNVDDLTDNVENLTSRVDDAEYEIDYMQRSVRRINIYTDY